MELFWQIMNWAAWCCCALLVFLIVKDFIKVEKDKKKQER
jgi:hypothetical protein